MLDKKVFSTQLNELAAYHNRPLSEFVERVWYKHLSKNLTTEQFEQAIEVAFVKCAFMPTPEQICEFGGGGQKSQILAQWERINEGRKSFCFAPGDTKGYDRHIDSLNLDSVALKALRLLGGLSALSNLNDSDIKWTREKFVEYYQLWEPKRSQLEDELQAEAALKASREIPSLPPSSLAPIPEHLSTAIDRLTQKVAIPEPEPKEFDLKTFEQNKAIAMNLIRSWSSQGLLETSVEQDLEF